MKELAEGIAYLHARKIVHGDLKDVRDRPIWHHSVSGT
jgi:serine/threonine protein kinase